MRRFSCESLLLKIKAFHQIATVNCSIFYQYNNNFWYKTRKNAERKTRIEKERKKKI
jgi:hypothetical protein